MTILHSPRPKKEGRGSAVIKLSAFVLEPAVHMHVVHVKKYMYTQMYLYMYVYILYVYIYMHKTDT